MSHEGKGITPPAIMSSSPDIAMIGSDPAAHDQMNRKPMLNLGDDILPSKPSTSGINNKLIAERVFDKVIG